MHTKHSGVYDAGQRKESKDLNDFVPDIAVSVFAMDLVVEAISAS